VNCPTCGNRTSLDRERCAKGTLVILSCGYCSKAGPDIGAAVEHRTGVVAVHLEPHATEQSIIYLLGRVPDGDKQHAASLLLALFSHRCWSSIATTPPHDGRTAAVVQEHRDWLAKELRELIERRDED
jgi:hypothetical protein